MITFNNKKDTDIDGLVLLERTISTPAKKKIKIDVPFMNSSYDFSTVGSNGEITYDQREIVLVFGIKALNKNYLQVKYSQVMEWLQDTGQQQLIFDDIPDYYFLSEIEESSSLEEVLSYGRLEVKFITEPFKIGVDLEGNKEWDTFNFEVDALQDTSFDVVGNADVNIYNVGRIVMPTIIADSSFTLTFNSETYNVVAGNNTFYDFKLQNGANNINIVGTGNIQFLFRKMVI